jgi:putative acetyltransferase
VVLGEPDFYGRFGFSPNVVRGLTTPYDGPYLQGIELTDRRSSGPVRYAPAFAGLA